MRVTIALCTRNNCSSLLSTLESLQTLRMDLPGELLLVDNGSTDGTWEALSAYSHPALRARRLREETPGLCYARNLALSVAEGDLIVFTDDDVRVCPEWIRSLTRPLLCGHAEAVVGGIKIAPHLLRPWMTSVHRAWLASTDNLDPDAPRHLIGANMAFVRTVLDAVPEFDVELGAGRLGGWDETLFSSQLREAGFRLKGAFDHAIEHHFNPSRLSRASFLNAARIQGRCHAYVDYHWHHSPRPGRRELLRQLLKLLLLRCRSPRQASEGVDETELALVSTLYMRRQWIVESRRPRNYEKHGLRRVRPAG